MSAGVLREAAAQIRNDRGGVVSRHTQDGRRWLPVADWLEAEADAHSGAIFDKWSGAECCCRMTQALDVARAYLDSRPEGSGNPGVTGAQPDEAGTQAGRPASGGAS